MKRSCLYCGSPIPDNVRGNFCDEDCEDKFDRIHAENERDHQYSMNGYLKNKLL